MWHLYLMACFGCFNATWWLSPVPFSNFFLQYPHSTWLPSLFTVSGWYILLWILKTLILANPIEHFGQCIFLSCLWIDFMCLAKVITLSNAMSQIWHILLGLFLLLEWYFTMWNFCNFFVLKVLLQGLQFNFQCSFMKCECLSHCKRNAFPHTSKSKGPGPAYRATPLYAKSNYRIKWEVAILCNL